MTLFHLLPSRLAAGRRPAGRPPTGPQKTQVYSNNLSRRAGGAAAKGPCGGIAEGPWSQGAHIPPSYTQ